MGDGVEHAFLKKKKNPMMIFYVLFVLEIISSCREYVARQTDRQTDMKTDGTFFLFLHRDQSDLSLKELVARPLNQNVPVPQSLYNIPSTLQINSSKLGQHMRQLFGTI